jgi:hypothetical protein
MNAFDRHADVLLSRHLDAQEHRPDCRSEDCEGCIDECDEDRDEQLDEWREELREERRERDW